MEGRVALETLGCKVNQYESSYLIQELDEAGYRIVPFREEADIFIVHSCAVTSRASYQTRQLLRRARRTNPLAKIVLAGCDAQCESDRICREGLATHLVGNTEKFRLVDCLNEEGTFSEPYLSVGNARSFFDFTVSPVSRMHNGRTRAFLKVQDGCDAFCTYCIVPHTRGQSRSLPAEDVQRQMERFIGSGYQEVILTGIHLGQWGKDLKPPQDLVGLLAHLPLERVLPRIRLSSLEPMEWSPKLINDLRSQPWICPHFHVPLQSGDAEILGRMHRPYTPHQYAELIHELHRHFPKASLGADVLVGFPGETERHFGSTTKLIEELPLSYLHVFPFSPRPGTPAATFEDRISNNEVKRRTQLLHQLNTQKKNEFRRRFLGHWVQVLVEKRVQPTWWQGTSENYLSVLFQSTRPLLQGSTVTVRLTDVTENGMEGKAEGYSLD